MEYLLNHLATIISVIIRLWACVILIVFCIPLQLQESQVRNGLRTLRIQLLWLGIILLVTNLVSIGLLTEGLSHTEQDTFINGTLRVVNALAILTISWIMYQMYHYQYSDENKERHKRIEQQDQLQQELEDRKRNRS